MRMYAAGTTTASPRLLQKTFSLFCVVLGQDIERRIFFDHGCVLHEDSRQGIPWVGTATRVGYGPVSSARGKASKPGGRTEVECKRCSAFWAWRHRGATKARFQAVGATLL